MEGSAAQQQAGVAVVLAAAAGGAQQAAVLPPDVKTYAGLLDFARRTFNQPDQELAFTDGQRDISGDQDVVALAPGQRVLVRPARAHDAGGERISFNPHPKTLTMAGDYEYFAAQGHHPLAFALAELVDNALRATKGGGAAAPRRITVQLVTDARGGAGMVAVSDNGSGMTVAELNSWAVMNLSMEDRGLLPPTTDEPKGARAAATTARARPACEPGAAAARASPRRLPTPAHPAAAAAAAAGGSRAAAGSRYLSSDISYFGVGSKNAAFYLGRTVKVVTKTADSDYVHELCIQAAELERRYCEGQAVYEEDMLHRTPGDACSMAPAERAFPQPQQMLAAEAASGGEGGGGAASFTRVLIYDLKPDVLAQLCDEDEGAGVLRDLAHLYHYYLHAAGGNAFTTSHASQLPNGERVPDIRVERWQGSAGVWARSLVEVDDDLESRYLAAQRASMEFVLSVPNHGKVEGVLWYFPYENDQETVPLDAHTMGRMLLTANRDGAGGATQTHRGGAGGASAAPHTQLGAPSHQQQLAAWQSQRGAGTQAGKGSGQDLDAEQDAGYAALLAACPTFEAFWQGRLIPGACVDTLPFIRAVRSKRTAAARDLLPDEAFARIRGALFFGPGFRVTRNKLTFRDNLALLLEGASPTDRHLERRFKDWLVNCHRTLDRSVRFEVLCSQSVQSLARKHLGVDVTVFERVHDGLQTISKGDVVRLNTKPAVLGRVVHFSIPQVVQAEGCYSGGRVTVTALPQELLGADNLHTWPLRRLEGLVSSEELADHVSRELAKLPATLRFEPLRLATGSVVSLPAGSSLPETSVAVVNGLGAKVVKALLGGSREALRVVSARARQRGAARGAARGAPRDQAGRPALPGGGGADRTAAAAGAALRVQSQTLYYLGPAGTARKRTAAAAGQPSGGGGSGGQADIATAAAPPADDAAGKRGRPRGKRRRKGAGAAEAGDAEKENELPAATMAEPGAEGGGKVVEAAAEPAEADEVPEGEVLLTAENRSPNHDTFQFQRITGGLTCAGCYVLQYSLLPELPGGRTLRLSIDLQVTPAAPVAFDIRGEGRAIALSKAVMLGEALPPLRLALVDAHGNMVPGGGGAWTERPVQLQVLAGGAPGGGAVLQELSVSADMEEAQDELLLTRLRIMGPPAPAAGGAGMRLFRPHPPPEADRTASGAAPGQRGAGSGPPVSLPIVRAVDVFLAAHVEGLAPQGFPLRLAPGAPHSVRLLAGHPFVGGAEAEEGAAALMTQLPAPGQALAAAEAMSGEALPSFKVQTLDVWGNATCPSDELPFEVALQCDAADPAACSFGVDDRGVAVVSGVSVYRQDAKAEAEGEAAASPPADAELSQRHALLLWPACAAVEAAPLVAALEVASPQQQLALELLVQPSTRPAELIMTYQGEELGRRTQEGAEGGEPDLVWQLAGVEAGSRVEGLAVRCVDEVGRPAAGGVRGKMQVSWAKGAKKALLGGDDIRLPPLQAPDAVGPAVPFWVRFIGDPKEWPGVSLDIQFEVSVAPGPPASWSVAIVDYARGAAAAAAAAAGRATGAERPGGDDLSAIPCGQPFYLEIEALDACHNRCCFASAEARPRPVVLAEAVDPEAALALEPDAWQHKWDNTQAGGDVCLFKLWLKGPPGPVKLFVRDDAGEDGASLLVPDELSVDLLPGPPAALVADCPPQLACGTRGLVESLPVRAVDAHGNLAESATFEVALQGSAFNADGSAAARVSAAGSNRLKLRGGLGAFKAVRLQAPAEGVYKLAVSSVSRKVAVQEATVLVQVAQQNFVVGLELLPASLPGEAGGAAGAGLQVLVALDTEDRAPLPWEAVADGLTLCLAPPGGEAGGKAKGGKGGAGAGRRADAVVLSPERLFDPAADEAAGLGAAVAEAAAAAAPRGCVVVFATPPLTAAGQYTLTAEYAERRPALLPGLSKQELCLRSTSAQLAVAAGPVAAAALQAGGADAEALAVSNGKDAGSRRLLRNAVVQLQDDHGNATPIADVPVRWRLLAADAGSRDDGAEAPQLVCAAGELQLASDERGRAFFGDVSVEAGTGRMPAGAGRALDCVLEAQVLLPRAKSRRSSSPGSSWVTVWTRPVVFADDAARIRQLQVGAPARAGMRARRPAAGADARRLRRLPCPRGALPLTQALQEQKEELQQRLAAVAEGVADVQQRVDAATREHAAAAKAAAKQLDTLRVALRRPELELPQDAREAAAALQTIKAAAAEQPEKPQLSGRYGGSRQSMTLSIARLLQSGDADLVGVFAQLGYVDEPRLSAVLAASYCAALQVMVVRSYEAIARLRGAAKAGGMAVPSMLSYSLIQEYTSESGPFGGDTVMRGVTPLARRLLEDACLGTDDPLPIPLPHTRQLCLLRSRSRDGQGLPRGLAAEEWPPGCLGYAVNLVRPALPGTRKGLMYAQMGRTLVFETIKQAAEYRQWVVQTLRGTTADIVTLDEGKLSGRGVVVGSNFRVLPVSDAPFRFGTIPPGQQAASQASPSQCAAAADALADALDAQRAAADELAAATAAAAAPEHAAAEARFEEMQLQLAELRQQLRQQQRAAEGEGGKRAGRATQARLTQARPTTTQAGGEREEAGGERVVDLTGDDCGGGGGEGRTQRSKRRRA
ncbi:SMCHD1 [Scenedesmus sp. PABB004]|nr:SMCHD1 [Scenedesmus sp. PABB004]